MHYKIRKLDPRYNYYEWFEHVISFSDKIAVHQGPLHFIEAQKWMIDAYGFSAEIRIWQEIKTQYAMRQKFQVNGPGVFSSGLPDSVNPHWSWSNGYNGELRIYLASNKELSAYKLALG